MGSRISNWSALLCRFSAKTNTFFLVRWSYKALLSIIQVVPHPDTDTFAVFCTSPGKEHQKTRVLIFRPVSSIPFIARSLPFQIRTIAPYLLARPLGHIFVGITCDWNVVLFGDNFKLAKEAGSTATGIVLTSTPQKRTLFQDIFGKAAFTEMPSTLSVVEGQYKNFGKTTVTKAFTVPTYLMPAFEPIFNHLIGGFLQPRSDEVPIQLMHDDEDVDMDEEPAVTAFHANSSARVVHQEEMNLLVTLFRDQSMKCTFSNSSAITPSM